MSIKVKMDECSVSDLEPFDVDPGTRILISNHGSGYQNPDRHF